MEKHAHDLVRLCNELGIGKAVFVGVSVGGYVFFEFWRQYRERVSALVLADTRAGADTPEGRAAREKSAEDVKLRGPSPFITAMLPKLLGRTTLQTRPDRVDAARAMMSRMTVPGIVAVQQGMAMRADSIPTLKTVTVPTLVMVGQEDELTPVSEAQLMHQQIPGSRMEIVPQAGHYAAFEQPEHCGKLLRGFFDQLVLS
jgi:pimeloyl-ACP methyl ester carboxylesterase